MSTVVHTEARHRVTTGPRRRTIARRRHGFEHSIACSA
ncbi:hypothetical protein A33K_13188 [Burkholderia humptydooensis MSMB43]|uniref:Uncharacterized protein n=1 Tax=Burkholderia humptydooensis MSMB43 TaxID=441157 RepID=A0ABN0GBR3_9BURK|nr:hypothetical protein A33K_13188 [Burkholderia humptydooensis MSMB43]